jgi:hypothetical protein
MSVGVTLAVNPRDAGDVYTHVMRPREMRSRKIHSGSSTRARIACALAVALAASLLAAPVRAGGPTDRRFVSARNGIAVEAPTGWTLSTHTGFPNILVLLLHPDGSRISVAVSETQARDAREVAEPNRRALEKQTGSAVTARAGARNGVELDGQAGGRNEGIVQLYLVRALAPEGPRQAIVVSLIAPQAALALRRADLDFVIGKLGLTAVTLLPATAPAKSGAGGSSAGERGAEKERR